MTKLDGPYKPVEIGITETEQLQKNIMSLLLQIGDMGTCKGCGAPIYWVTHKNGKKAPYTTEGLNHFIDCPSANRFKKT